LFVDCRSNSFRFEAGSEETSELNKYLRLKGRSIYFLFVFRLREASSRDGDSRGALGSP